MYLPLWWRALLLHLCEDTIRLVIYALRASRQLAIAFDLLLSTHVASLSSPNQRPTSQDRYCAKTSLTLAILLLFGSLESSSNIAESGNI